MARAVRTMNSGRAGGDGAWRQVVPLVLAQRLAVALVALATAWVFAGPSGAASVDQRWTQWDVVHFVGLAKAHSYAGDPTGVPNEAFFPGLPAVMVLGMSLGLSAVTSGLVLSAVATLVAAAGLYRLAEPEAAGLGRATVMLWLAGPLTVFLAAPYSEAAFAAAAFWAWVAVRHGRWALAGVLNAVACTMRITGVFLLFAMLVAWVLQPRVERRVRDLVGAAVAGLALVGVWWFQYTATGSPTAYLDAQAKGWHRQFTLPWDALRATWEAAFGGGQQPQYAFMFGAELVAWAIAVIVCGWVLARRRWAEAAFLLPQVLVFTCSSWLMSVPRALLLWWPVWIGLAALLQRRPALQPVYLAVSLGLAGFWCVAFLTGHWTG